jgi:hypothetical protein
MKRALAIALVLACASSASAQLTPEEVVLLEELAPVPAEPPPPLDLTTIPMALGLPVQVGVGVAVIDVGGVSENDEAFDATIDLRLVWSDPRLAYVGTGSAHRFAGETADAQLAQIWHPSVRIANVDGDPSYAVRGLRIEPSGAVELLERTTARFHTSFDVSRFPFDRQDLAIEIVCDGASRSMVSLVVRQADLDFSRLAGDVHVDGWSPIGVVLHRERVPGWHGDVHDAVRASIGVARDAAHTAAPIFIPLFASLLIPLLAMWLNRWEDGDFKIEAFELANVIVGGLFAIIALNFTVSSELSALGVGDNTVSRLFALNYLTLATSLLVNLGLFRYRIVGRAFGPFVEEQAFRFLTWALPLIAVSTALACVAAAYA